AGGLGLALVAVYRPLLVDEDHFLEFRPNSKSVRASSIRHPRGPARQQEMRLDLPRQAFPRRPGDEPADLNRLAWQRQPDQRIAALPGTGSGVAHLRERRMRLPPEKPTSIIQLDNQRVGPDDDAFVVTCMSRI